MLTFAHPEWLLGLCAIPVAWLAFPFGRLPRSGSARAVCALVRSAVLTVVILALAEPYWAVRQRCAALAEVVLLKDCSLSITHAAAAATAKCQQYAAALRDLGRIQTLCFGDTVWNDDDKSLGGRDGTNIELALVAARSRVSAGRPGAVVLFTDGRSTVGDPLGAAMRLRAQGTPVHVVSVGAEVKKGPRLVGVEPPTNLRLGEEARIQVRVRTDIEGPVELRLTDPEGIEVDHYKGRHLGEVAAVLRYVPQQSGLVACRVLLTGSAAGPGEQTVAEVPLYVEGPPRVLLIDAAPQEARYLTAALREAHLTCEVQAAAGAELTYSKLATFDAIVLSDCPEPVLGSSFERDMLRYVEDTGGGLLFVGGANVNTESWHGSVLQQALPIEFVPEDVDVVERVSPFHVCFVLDKSGSMAEPLGQSAVGMVTKIDMVKAAVQRSAGELPTEALISVVAFDAVPLVLADSVPKPEWTRASGRIDGLAADGGTIMGSAIEKGLELLTQADLPRYMILLTDGQTAPDSPLPPARRFDQLARQIQAADVSLATIALGKLADRALLSHLAWMTGGTSYYCDAADEIPKVFIEQTETIKQIARAPVDPFHPMPGPDADQLAGIAVESCPVLKRALRARPKEFAQIILVTDKSEPLLAQWRYGLGTVVAFMSDVKPTWAREWILWNDFRRFWNQVVAWTLRSSTHLEADVTPIVKADELRVLVRLAREDSTPASGLQAAGRLLATGETGAEAELVWREVRPGLYEGLGQLNAQENQLCRLQFYEKEKPVFSHTMLVRATRTAELAETGPQPEALAAIARAGGGLVDPSPATIAQSLANSADQYVTSKLPLWPALIAAAAILWFLDVATRRFSTADAQ